MKKLIVLAVVIFPLLSKAQTKINCDALVAENQALRQDTTFLKEKLAYFEKINSSGDLIVTSFSSQFDVKVLACKGDRGAQTVKVDFVIRHKKANQYFSVKGYGSKAYDEIGNSFSAKLMSIGTKQESNMASDEVPTDIDVKGFVTFRGVIGGTDELKLVQISVSSMDSDGYANQLEGKIDIRNIKIDW